MSNKLKLVVLNELRASLGQKPLKGWKQSGAKLDEKIAELKKQLAAQSMQDAIDEAGEAPEPRGDMNHPVVDEKPKSKKRGTTIASVVRPLIEAGHDNVTIFEMISESNPGLLPIEKKWYIAWYRGDMRRKAEKAKS